jgi:hypothetical protein
MKIVATVAAVAAVLLAVMVLVPKQQPSPAAKRAEAQRIERINRQVDEEFDREVAARRARGINRYCDGVLDQDFRGACIDEEIAKSDQRDLLASSVDENGIDVAVVR